MPDPQASEAAAAAAGLALPKDSDLISGGDDAIRINARFTTDALTRAAAAETTAAAAVTEAESKADQADALRTVPDSPVVFAVVDEAGRRTWLEAGADGGPSAHSASKMGNSAPLVDAVGAGVGLRTVGTDATSLIFAVTDEAGRRTELELDAAGRVPARVLTAWAGRMGAAASGPTYPVPAWAAWGDSMTGDSWPGLLQTSLGVPVHGGGVGGQQTFHIAARQGGVPPRLTLAGNAVPASGSVAVTALTNTPFNNPGSMAGTVAGVPGTLARATDGTHTFTRAASGTAVAAAPGVHFITEHAATMHDRHTIIWAGRNDTERTSADDVAQRIRQMIDHLTPRVRRVIVVGVSPSVGEEYGTALRTKLDDFNAVLRTSFRPYWLDLAAWLQTDAAATAAGITFTAEDRSDIAAGLLPRSFRRDGLHFNAAGNTAAAARFKTEAQNRGWI